MKGEKHMTGNKKRIFFLLWFCLALVGYSNAQDRIPSVAAEDIPIHTADTLRLWGTPDTIAVGNSLPPSFLNPGTNGIRNAYLLYPFFERLRNLREDTIRIVHIGDSHVRGHIFPRTTAEALRNQFGAIRYTDMGINGATCLTFTHPERIAAISALKPDLLILSFGTNESHTRKYNSSVHYQQMNELIRLLRDSLPDTPMLATTPPGSYESYRQRRRKRTYTINPRTVTAVETICRFADSHRLAVWDLYNLAGGKKAACVNWQTAGWMRPDHVHYMPEGYALQGYLFYEAILKAYNEYVISH